MERGLLEPVGSVSTYFAEQAEKCAARVALACSSGTFTYSELQARSLQLGSYLVRQYGEGAEPIALLARDPYHLVSAALGVLAAGKFFVPLDVSSPPRRLRGIMADLGARAMLADTDFERMPQIDIVRLDSLDSSDAGDFVVGRTPDRSAVDLSHVLYTSGTTAHPKGVMQQHGNIMMNAARTLQGFSCRQDDRFGVVVPLISGQGLAMLFGALLGGLTLAPYDMLTDGLGGLPQWLSKQSITVLASTPSLLRAFADSLPAEASFDAVRAIRLSGEPAYFDDVARLRRVFPRAQVVNVLGASETGVIAQYAVQPESPLASGLLPVGQPCQDVEVIIDESGEMLVRGRHLSLGYWNDEALTAERFLEDAVEPGKRVFRSGDGGRWLEDGALVHLGRLDARLKIRGVAVSPAEVEMALRRLPDVSDAAVVGACDAEGETHIVAFVRTPLPQLDPRCMLALREELPAPMLPACVVTVEQLPTLASGKLDRSALLSRARELLSSPRAEQRSILQPYTPARDPFEMQLVELWEQLLSVRPIGVDQDFFLLGGNSLLAARMLLQLEQLTGRRIALAAMYEDATISRLAALTTAGNDEPVEPIMLVAEGEAHLAPLFFFHGDVNGGGFYSKPLLQLLGRRCYVVHPHGIDGQPVPASIEAMAVERARSIAASSGSSTIHLAGYCNGGLVAYETARRLRSMGRDVGAVILIETPARRVRNPLLRVLISLVQALIEPPGRLTQSVAPWSSLLARLWRWTPLARLRGWLTGRWDRHQGTLFRRYSDLAAAYHPGWYGGAVTLLATRQMRVEAPFDASAGWSARCASCRVRHLNGNHISAITEQRQALAAAMAAVMHEADGTPAR